MVPLKPIKFYSTARFFLISKELADLDIIYAMDLDEKVLAHHAKFDYNKVSSLHFLPFAYNLLDMVKAYRFNDGISSANTLASDIKYTSKYLGYVLNDQTYIDLKENNYTDTNKYVIPFELKPFGMFVGMNDNSILYVNKENKVSFLHFINIWTKRHPESTSHTNPSETLYNKENKLLYSFRISNSPSKIYVNTQSKDILFSHIFQDRSKYIKTINIPNGKKEYRLNAIYYNDKVHWYIDDELVLEYNKDYPIESGSDYDREDSVFCLADDPFSDNVFKIRDYFVVTDFDLKDLSKLTYNNYIKFNYDAIKRYNRYSDRINFDYDYFNGFYFVTYVSSPNGASYDYEQLKRIRNDNTYNLSSKDRTSDLSHLVMFIDSPYRFKTGVTDYRHIYNHPLDFKYKNYVMKSPVYKTYYIDSKISSNNLNHCTVTTDLDKLVYNFVPKVLSSDEDFNYDKLPLLE